MTYNERKAREEAMARAREKAKALEKAKEKARKHEYYIANRERILERMSEYAKRTRPERTAKEKEYREKNALKHAESQLKYWTRKVAELKGEQK